MRPATLLVALTLFSPLGAKAFAQPEAMQPTPEFAIVGKVDAKAGTVELKFAFHVIRMVEEVRTKEVGGKKVMEKVKVPALQLRVETEEFSLEETVVIDIQGKKVAKADVLKRVKTGQAVLVSSSDQAVSAAVAKAVAADTLVFVSPPEEAEGPAPSPPPAGPPTR